MIWRRSLKIIILSIIILRERLNTEYYYFKGTPPYHADSMSQYLSLGSWSASHTCFLQFVGPKEEC